MSHVSDEALRSGADELGELLRQRGLMITTAESCTGGWIAKALTDTPGSSDYFGTGLVTYSNAAKEGLIGVTPLSLEKQGAVSEAVVREMVLGTLTFTGADLAVAVSGVAGPDGGTDDKPVGTVWFAWGDGSGDPQAVCERFAGDREAVRRQSVLFALQGVRGYLQDNR